MDSTVSEFLNSGSRHPTDKSHRAAAKEYSKFLSKESKSRRKDRIRFSRPQLADLRA